jgi:signal transduction histidine kinase
MRNLINDLLALSRVTTQAKPSVPVDLNTVVSEVLSDLEVLVEQVGGKVEVGSLPTLDADPTQMRQLFQNLIGNALKFRKKDIHPVIQVQAEPVTNTGLFDDDDNSRRQWQIKVQDNGIGFDEKYRERIFEVFQRLHSRSEYEGSGIGLSLCRKIVTRHGGSIAADSVPGQGATFMITLPEKHAEPESAIKADAAAKNSPAAGGNGKPSSTTTFHTKVSGDTHAASPTPTLKQGVPVQ